MKRKWLRRAVLSLMACSAIAGIVPGAEAADVRILPIDTAKFVPGAKFDFDVEVANATDLKNVDITINGKKADSFFRKNLSKKSLDNGVVSYRVNDVHFAKAGTYTVKATATDATGNSVSQATYTVVQQKAARPAKNVILFVGDGMSLQARQMARILSKGMTNGKYNDLLAMEKMPHNCLITTSGYDSLTTDSANSASAYATGHKSVVNAFGVYEDSTADPFDDPRVENVAEIVKRTRGMSVGIITQAESTDATPAAMIAHTRRRANQDAVASQYLEDFHRPDVIMGGGFRRYIPQEEQASKRHDTENVITEFKNKGYTYVTNATEMMAAPTDKPLLGLFHPGTMNVYLDREILKDPSVLGAYTDQPNLVDMTKKSLDILSRNPNGFFAMIEGASIDKQLHAMDWQRATYDTIEFDKAIEYAQKWNKEHGDNTLLIVVADHAHGASITGTYHERDGKKGLDAVRTYADSIFPTFTDANHDGFPDNPDPDVTLAVQYANHPSYYENYHFQKKPTLPTVEETVTTQQAVQAGEKTEYHQVSTVIAKPNPARHHEGDPEEITPATYSNTIGDECHAADDVPLNAEGPGSEYFNGVMDNTDVFFGIMRALGIDATKNVK